MNTTNQKAKKIVGDIINDLTGRQGLKHEWGCIDKEIKEEIIETWVAIVERELPDWKPIETAPKDENFFLIYTPQKFNHGFYIVHWCHDHFQTCDTTWIGKDLPTYWTELPEPPEDK